MEIIGANYVSCETSASSEKISMSAPVKRGTSVKGQIGAVWHLKNVWHMGRGRDVENCNSLFSTLEYIKNARVESPGIEDWSFTGFEPDLLQIVVILGLLNEVDE